ncbi:hypothetical protein [Polystyrenella longa]|uniref:hypothetical protein n=1 Tax=Polystyrenella longa TaxID=2528007 RepID=UPI0011A43DBF|nr:hypothetical protein [Polystyrenella longa]
MKNSAKVLMRVTVERFNLDASLTPLEVETHLLRDCCGQRPRRALILGKYRLSRRTKRTEKGEIMSNSTRISFMITSKKLDGRY